MHAHVHEGHSGLSEKLINSKDQSFQSATSKEMACTCDKDVCGIVNCNVNISVDLCTFSSIVYLASMCARVMIGVCVVCWDGVHLHGVYT